MMLTLTAETHLRVTPKGFVNLLCGTCDCRLTVEQAVDIQGWLTIPCRNCGEDMRMDGNLTFDVRADHEHLLTTTSTVWYHVTTCETWNETPETLYVHVGTPQTVAWYAGECFKTELRHGQTLNFWRVELSDEAQANTETTIYRDNNRWPKYRVSDNVILEFGIAQPAWPVKYVNRYELPGSISLLTEFKHLASVERIPDETAKGMFQYDPKKEFSE